MRPLPLRTVFAGVLVAAGLAYACSPSKPAEGPASSSDPAKPRPEHGPGSAKGDGPGSSDGKGPGNSDHKGPGPGLGEGKGAGPGNSDGKGPGNSEHKGPQKGARDGGT